MSIIKFKKKEQEVATPCTHDSLSIDRVNKQITCRDCDAVLDPFEEIMNYSDALDDFREQLEFIRGQLQQDSARNQIVARRLENKQRTKFQHCNKMTEVKIKEPTILEMREEMVKGSV